LDLIYENAAGQEAHLSTSDSKWLEKIRELIKSNVDEDPPFTFSNKDEFIGEQTELEAEGDGNITSQDDQKQVEKIPQQQSLEEGFRQSHRLTGKQELIVTPNQQTQADLFARITHGRNVGIPTKPVVKRSIRFDIKLWVLLCFLSLLFLFVYLDHNLDVGLETSPLSLDSLLVESVKSESQAILAVDYRLGYTLELEPALRTVLAELIEQEVRVTLVSTRPEGVLLAQRLLEKPLQLISDDEAINNDGPFFIPGEEVGLLKFAHAGIENINDHRGIDLEDGQVSLFIDEFDLVVIATDDYRIAQKWIEQVNRLLEGTPSFVVISSLQSYPLLKTYESNSVTQKTLIVSPLQVLRSEEMGWLQFSEKFSFDSLLSFLILFSTVLPVVGITNAILTRKSTRK
jgi:hypothetical protein